MLLPARLPRHQLRHFGEPVDGGETGHVAHALARSQQVDAR
jgi:hypothetical protein